MPRQAFLNMIQGVIDQAQARGQNVDDAVTSAMRDKLNTMGWAVVDVRVDLQQAHSPIPATGTVGPGSPSEGLVTVRSSGGQQHSEIHWNRTEQPGANVPETRHMLLPLHNGHISVQVDFSTPGLGTARSPALNLTGMLHHETGSERDARLGEERGTWHRDGYRLSLDVLRDPEHPGDTTITRPQGPVVVTVAPFGGDAGSETRSDDTLTTSSSATFSVNRQVQGQATLPIPGAPTVSDTLGGGVEGQRGSSRTTGGDLHQRGSFQLGPIGVNVGLPNSTATTPRVPTAHIEVFDHLAAPGHRRVPLSSLESAPPRDPSQPPPAGGGEEGAVNVSVTTTEFTKTDLAMAEAKPAGPAAPPDTAVAVAAEVATNQAVQLVESKPGDATTVVGSGDAAVDAHVTTTGQHRISQSEAAAGAATASNPAGTGSHDRLTDQAHAVLRNPSIRTDDSAAPTQTAAAGTSDDADAATGHGTNQARPESNRTDTEAGAERRSHAEQQPDKPDHPHVDRDPSTEKEPEPEPPPQQNNTADDYSDDYR